jgi:hypothetical protein
MPSEEIDGVPIWYEEHGDSDGRPLVALHGGILTFEELRRRARVARSFELFPDSRLAVLPGTKHTEVMQRSEQLRALVNPFLD